MHLPPAVSRVLESHAVPADTVVRFQDLYLSLGGGTVEAMGELCEELQLSPSELKPEALAGIRPRMGDSYLREFHGDWFAGSPSRAFWKERSLAGMVGGTVQPLGLLAASEEATSGTREQRFSRSDFLEVAANILGESQKVDRGLLLLSRHSHSSGREGSFSVDLMPEELDDALALNRAEGRQHTVPGSAGETSGTTFGEDGLALVWEIQPSIYKPGKERNRGAGKASRRYRNWHVVTLLGALTWLARNDFRIFTLLGKALKPAHECDPADALGDGVAALHDRTLLSVTEALGWQLELPAADVDVARLATSVSSALGRVVRDEGVGEYIAEIRRSGDSPDHS